MLETSLTNCGYRNDALLLDLEYKDTQIQREQLDKALITVKYTRILARSLVIPDLHLEEQEKTLWNPWQDEDIQTYHRHLADYYYYTFPYEEWKKLLTEIYNVSVKPAQIKWKKELSDCDNMAESMHYAMQLAARRTDFEHNVAIGIAWSGTHAYNIFVDNDGVKWVYEPQNNKIKGRLGETKDPFDTKLLLFIG